MSAHQEPKGETGVYEMLVPQDKALRNDLRQKARDYVEKARLTPPLSMEEIEDHTSRLMRRDEITPEYRPFVMVLINNEAWRRTVGNIAYDRRVLLIPQCLRDSENCPAEIDEFGLLCEQCGRCPIAELEERAEALGYFVLVAEGTTVVTKLIEQGKVHGVVGVSCLSVLERAFPHMATHAIPGVAIPLLKDGCRDTKADVEWILEALVERSEDSGHLHIDLDKLRDEVQGWFAADVLRPLLALEGTHVEQIGHEWMLRGGKRWRPLLTAAVYQALTGSADPAPEAVRRVAVAVECFHKASLIHDDIEDDDERRYGEETLHLSHGVPIALNAGDFLLGEGYRLIGECGLACEIKARMLSVAAQGHRNLCLGQGEELFWRERRETATLEQVLRIFERKTSPAFEVALVFGALCAGADDALCQTLQKFSAALGIAYQIRDDILDYLEDREAHSGREWSPSIISALRKDRAARLSETDQAPVESVPAGEPAEVQKARQLLEHYRLEAMRALRPLASVHLKSLLHRLTGRILKSV
jgi:geranylgeranyl pyrophosphate synthase